MLADFFITIHSDPPRTVNVKVYKTVAAMRSAKTQNDRRWFSKKQQAQKKKDGENQFLGICECFELENVRGTPEAQSLCAIIRLAQSHIGIGIVSHEMAHAAVWINQLNKSCDPLISGNDEEFCWILGELVRQTINKFHDKGIYT